MDESWPQSHIEMILAFAVMTHPYVLHDFFAHQYVRNDLCICENAKTWHDSSICSRKRDLHDCSHARRDSSICTTWLCHVCDATHLDVRCAARLIHMCDIILSNARHDSSISVTWLVRMCDATHLDVRQDSLICVTWLSYARHASYTCVTWLIHMCDMALPYVWRDTFGCMAGLIDVCDTTLSHARHDSSRCATSRHDSSICLFCRISSLLQGSFAKETYNLKEPTSLAFSMWDVTRQYVRHDSFICVTRLFHMCDMTHAYVWHDAFMWLAWLIHMGGMAHLACHESIIWPTWPVLIWK